LIGKTIAPYSMDLLDGFRLRHEAVEVTLPIGAQRLIALVALGTSRTRSHISSTLWPDATEDQAAACLRSMIWRVRKLAPGIL
jgi:DNA-binding SARP family transcriptional activator